MLVDPRTPLLIEVQYLTIHPEAQRGIDDKHVQKIEDSYDVNKAVPPLVTPDPNNFGYYIVMSSQHTVRATYKKYGPTAKLWCISSNESLDSQRQSEIVRGQIENTKNHTPYDKWNMDLNAGIGYVVSANKIILDNGYNTVSGTRSDANTIASVETIRGIIATGNQPRLTGLRVLDQTLKAIREAFPDSHEEANRRTNQILIRGIAEVFSDSEKVDRFDEQRLINRLAEMYPSEWIDTVGGTYKDKGLNHKFQAITLVLKQRYNLNYDKRGKARFLI